jgi:hypothetical protein
VRTVGHVFLVRGAHPTNPLVIQSSSKPFNFANGLLESCTRSLGMFGHSDSCFFKAGVSAASTAHVPAGILLRFDPQLLHKPLHSGL